MTATKLDLETANFNPNGWFIAQVTNEGVYLRTPDNQMLSMNQDARLEVNATRAAWMSDTLNNALRESRAMKL